MKKLTSTKRFVTQSPSPIRPVLTKASSKGVTNMTKMTRTSIEPSHAIRGTEFGLKTGSARPSWRGKGARSVSSFVSSRPSFIDSSPTSKKS